MFRYAIFAAFTALAALPAYANDFAKVTDKSEFLKLVDGRDLRIGMFNLTLQLRKDGTISGSALGWEITGSWVWKDGYFCREMDWSGKAIDYNCQLVEAQGAEKLRFTVDKGDGDSASFDLR